MSKKLRKAIDALREVSPRLNDSTTAANEVVERVERFLNDECSIGLPCWIAIAKGDTDEDVPGDRHLWLGYDRINGRFCIAIERLDAASEASEKAHLDAIRRRVRAHRALLDEVGCPPPPFSAVSANLIWNIQNAPAAQITMLLGVHGPAWAPVGACSTFGVALKCGRDAILRGEAKVAIVGTTDPRPDPALVGAFHDARVMAYASKVVRIADGRIDAIEELDDRLPTGIAEPTQGTGEVCCRRC